jgi:predicted DNA-binding transcriptional regulator YafY
MQQLTLDKIKQAAKERKVLRIIYIEKDGTSEGWRYIEPYSFSHQNGQIDGLYAWDRNKSGIRRFILEQIQEVEVTEESFIPRYQIKINWL